MSDTLSTVGTIQAPAVGRKGLDLAVLKKGAKDYLDFLDSSKEVFYAYLYHRTGSVALAQTLLGEVYLQVLSRAMSLWWFGNLSLKILLNEAEHALQGRETSAADLDTVYLKSLPWLSATEKTSVGSLHDALWSLPASAQQLLILSLLVGLSEQKIAVSMGRKEDAVQGELKTAKELLLSRWNPAADIQDKLGSLVFVPALDLRAETQLRFSVVEKYNALRFRRYQWVIIGGLFAVMSNVIVASVLAFAVIVQPSSSLKGERTSVASLDAVLLEREAEVDRAKQSIAAQYQESQRIAAYDVSRDLTNLGLATALEALRKQQTQEKDVNRILKVLERAKTALRPYSLPALQLAMGWLPLL